MEAIRYPETSVNYRFNAEDSRAFLDSTHFPEIRNKTCKLFTIASQKPLASIFKVTRFEVSMAENNEHHCLLGSIAL
jgi:hypothetical protein